MSPGYDYRFLNEVQNLPGWDMWVSKLYRRGKNLVITGSNAKLLSSETIKARAITKDYLSTLFVVEG
nr:AAA family ATPase [uncultured Duncaniella sp.]